MQQSTIRDEDSRLYQLAASSPEAFTKPFCDFLEQNPTIFHAVDYFKEKLRRKGFEEACTLAPRSSI